jgi:hypothetical protein
MPISFSKLKNKLLDANNFAETFVFGRDRNVVKITKDLSLYVDEQKIDVEFSSLEEAVKYSKDHIKTQELIKSIDITIPEEKVASYIKKHYNIEKITDTLVESYIELASSNIFTIDPVIQEMKTGSAIISGKFDYKLNDNSIVAINETTQCKLNILLKDRPEIIEYMRDSKENFIRIVKEL